MAFSFLRVVLLINSFSTIRRAQTVTLLGCDKRNIHDKSCQFLSPCPTDLKCTADYFLCKASFVIFILKP